MILNRTKTVKGQCFCHITVNACSTLQLVLLTWTYFPSAAVMVS